jgi:hypothetical protein
MNDENQKAGSLLSRPSGARELLAVIYPEKDSRSRVALVASGWLLSMLGGAGVWDRDALFGLLSRPALLWYRG